MAGVRGASSCHNGAALLHSELRELLPTMVLHSADRFRAAAAPHVVVYVLFRIMNGGTGISGHTGHQTTLNYPLLGGISRALPTMPTMVLHSADRFRAAAAPHVVVYVFVSNYEWRESETLSFNVCLRVHTLDTKQP
ncbi:hypothetical protein TcBrA4_0020490 [Trypanosoma cruzi]|nr:hypothetical protein TcBrA4_0020490 [Trypanosoma cruzi]